MTTPLYYVYILCQLDAFVNPLVFYVDRPCEKPVLASGMCRTGFRVVINRIVPMALAKWDAYHPLE